MDSIRLLPLPSFLLLPLLVSVEVGVFVWLKDLRLGTLSANQTRSPVRLTSKNSG